MASGCEFYLIILKYEVSYMQNVDTTKYVIYADITAEGIVERPDVDGAIFVQTEGLL